MKAVYRWGGSLAVLLIAGAAAFSLSSREITAAEPQAQSAQAQSPHGQSGAQTAPAAKGAAASQDLIARGEYLVDHVGMCSECHTPRDAYGNLDNAHYLQGAPIWIVPVHPMTNWANRAPALAGFEGFTDAQGETILEKGVGPNGLDIQPPMHIYRMNHADAQAIIAYLRSLPSNYTQP
jgi:mono/diheme cytochrome c family protein